MRPKQLVLSSVFALFAFTLTSCAAPETGGEEAASEAEASAPELQTSSDEPMTFFLTSVGVGNGADLGGLEGADAHCMSLAQAGTPRACSISI